MVQDGQEGEEITGVVKHGREFVVTDDLLKRCRYVDHLDEGSVLLLNQIKAILAPCLDHHLAVRIQDLLDETDHLHLGELLRKDGRRVISRLVEIALSVIEGKSLDEAQRVPSDLENHVDLICTVERQEHVMNQVP